MTQPLQEIGTEPSAPQPWTKRPSHSLSHIPSHSLSQDIGMEESIATENGYEQLKVVAKKKTNAAGLNSRRKTGRCLG